MNHQGGGLEDELCYYFIFNVTRVAGNSYSSVGSREQLRV